VTEKKNLSVCRTTSNDFSDLLHFLYLRFT
jgi:hypothetical protein